MNVLKVIEPGKIAVQEMDGASLEKGEVKIRIRRVGICGSDIHIYKGSNPFTVYPRVIGHEMAGEVLEVASDVKRAAIGDKVVIDPVLNCGRCDTCRRGHPNVCSTLEVMGVHRDGGFADEIIVPEANVYTVPSDMEWDTAVMVEPFSIGANVCSRTAVGEGDRVLIVGSGVIGNTVLLTAKMLGAEVISCDIDDAKLAHAKKIGADHTINSRNSSLKDELERITNGDGVTVVIDAACIAPMFQTLLECAAPGGRVGVLGFAKEFSEVNQFEITRKELTVCGSRLNNRMFPAVIKSFEEGRIKPELLIEKVTPFSRVRDVLEEIVEAGGMNGKTIVSMDE
jgi:L-gulonate 5-dehydrogenase